MAKPPAQSPKKRTAIVPRAVFAAVVTLASIPSAAACRSHEPPASRRAAELRPITTPGSSPPPPPTKAPPATLTAMPTPDLGTDLGIDAGDAAGAHAKRARRVRRRVFGVALQPPGVAAFPGVAAYGVAMRQFTVAAPIE